MNNRDAKLNQTRTRQNRTKIWRNNSKEKMKNTYLSAVQEWVAINTTWWGHRRHWSAETCSVRWRVASKRRLFGGIDEETQRKTLRVNTRFSQASHWNGKPDEVNPNLGFRVWAEIKGWSTLNQYSHSSKLLYKQTACPFID